MLVSSVWLHELWGCPPEGPLPGAKLDDLLTGLGLEVEGIVEHGKGWAQHVVVGEIISVEPVPKTKKLSLVALQDGQVQRQVVCGASNLPAPGGKVAFARAGAVLPGDFKIGTRTLKGVESEGMICSAAELEIGADDDGIMVLPQEWEHGKALADYLPGIVDDVLEISVTPNRPDALGHLGIAKDLAVKLGYEVKLPEHWSQDLAPVSGLVDLQAPARCGQYHAATLEDLQVGPSPMAVAMRLHRVGQRSINSAVDVSNYVMMESGQPLHVFDRDKLDGDGVVIRMAKAGEPLSTLDGTKIALRDQDLVIADHKAPQALAGVMGGEDSMIQAQSKRALLEAAWFSPGPVRASAKHFGFHTDSSHRFERGVDFGAGLDFAFRRALHLLVAWTGAKVTGGASAKGECPGIPEISFRPAQVEVLLGMPIAPSFCEKVLKGLGMELDVQDASCWKVRPPSARPDLTREVDLIEEVMRHHGLQDLPSEHCVPSAPAKRQGKAPVWRLADTLTSMLSSQRYHECVNLVFCDETSAGFGQGKPVKLHNPLRVQDNCLRTSLAPGLFDALALNAGRHDRELRLFEVGRVYHWPSDGQAPSVLGDPGKQDAALPSEQLRAGICRMGEPRPLQGKVQRDASVHALTVDLQRLFGRLGLDLRITSLSEPPSYLHPGVCAQLCVQASQGEPVPVGFFGQLHPDTLKAQGLPDADRPAYAELCLASIAGLQCPLRAQVPPRFPATARDISLLLPKDLSVDACVAALQGAACAIGHEGIALAPGDRSAKAIEVVEVYQTLDMSPGSRAVLFRLYYRAQDRSLKDKEAQSLHDELIKQGLESLRAQGHEITVR